MSRGRWLPALAALTVAGLVPSAAPGQANWTIGGYTTSDYEWALPDWMPRPLVPADNPMNAAKVELGRHLFYDTRLSLDATMSCASCHRQELAFTDGRKRSEGVKGDATKRNSMTLVNVAYTPTLTWANPLITSLEQHALSPMFGFDPPELGMGGREQELFARLADEPKYSKLFAEAFPEFDGRIDLFTVTRALGAFQRTIVTAGSPYDRYRYGGDENAISASAKRGEALFFSERLECHHCHNGLNMNDNARHGQKPMGEVGFHNTGLYNVDGSGGYPSRDTGVRDVTYRFGDEGRFRTPTLRNVVLTAPYMHDGSAATLDDVIDHYEAGGRRIADGPDAGDGSKNPLKSVFVVGFRLTPAEREDLKAFLASLTDEEILYRDSLSNPWQ